MADVGAYQYTRPRKPIAAMHKGPGPCYPLRTMCRFEEHSLIKCRKPAYSMCGRGKLFSDDCSPGPKYYIDKGFTNKGSDGTPHVGITGRHADLKSFNTPAPDCYNVSTADKQVSRNAPAYSLHTRTAQSKCDNNPAANTYQLPSTIANSTCPDKSCAPATSLRSRPAVGSFSEDLKKTPGPGTYKVTEPGCYKNRQPMYSMTGKNDLPGDTTKKPGPGAHSPLFKGTKRQPPSCSFGMRHSEYIAPLIVDADCCC